MKNGNPRRMMLNNVAIMIPVGVIGVIAAAFFAEAYTPAAGTFSSAFAGGLTTISVAIIGVAIFSFALDTKNWQEYFAERLKDVVIESEYLKGLDQETLKDIQTRVLKAQFNSQAIDKEGSFLNYFHLNLHRYISEPYREDVSTEVIMKFDGARDDAYHVIDKVRYVCRSSGGKIQTHVGWKPDDGEFECVKSLKIAIQFPSSHKEAGKRVCIYEKQGEELSRDLIGGVPKLGISSMHSKYSRRVMRP